MLKNKSHYRNFKQASICSFSFLGIYIAVYSAQNLQSQIYETGGYGSLGLLSTAVAYIGQGTGSIFCVYIMQRIGDIKAMAYSSIMSLPSMLCLLVPSIRYYYPDSDSFLFSYGFVFLLTFITSFMNGFGEGVAQPASGKFISDCATEKTKGFFFAYFWAFYMGSQIFGNLIAAFALGHLPQYYYVIITVVICSAGIALLFFLKPPFVVHHNNIAKLEAYQAAQEQESVNAINNESSTSTDLDESLVLEDVELDGEMNNGRMNLKEVVISMWKLASSKRFRFFIPQLFWTGVSIAFFSGNLVTLMYQTIDGDDSKKFELSTYAMVLFGCGEVLGCFFIGFFVDKYGSKVASVVNICIMGVMIFLTLLYVIIWDFSALAFFMCFFWGFQDSAINTHSQEILGFEFDNNSEPFSVYNILQCGACAFFSLIEVYVDTQTDFLIFTIFIGLFGIFCATTTMFFDFKEHKSHHGVLDQLHDPLQRCNSEFSEADIVEIEERNKKNEKKKNRHKGHNHDHHGHEHKHKEKEVALDPNFYLQ